MRFPTPLTAVKCSHQDESSRRGVPPRVRGRARARARLLSFAAESNRAVAPYWPSVTLPFAIKPGGEKKERENEGRKGERKKKAGQKRELARTVKKNCGFATQAPRGERQRGSSSRCFSFCYPRRAGNRDWRGARGASIRGPSSSLPFSLFPFSPPPPPPRPLEPFFPIRRASNPRDFYDYESRASERGRK